MSAKKFLKLISTKGIIACTRPEGDRKESSMEINTTIDGANATIALVGTLTVATVPQLEAAFADLPEEVTNLVLDLAELEYVASAGLRVIVSQAKNMARNGNSMRITNPNEEVMEVFDVTGLIDILDIVQ